MEKVFKTYQSRYDWGCLTAPNFVTSQFSTRQGGNYNSDLYTHAIAFTIASTICCLCSGIVESFDEATPHPFHQEQTPNPPYNLSKHNIYCRCGNVYHYNCKPLRNSEGIIPIGFTTQQQRLDQKCVWCESFPPCVEASKKVYISH